MEKKMTCAQWIKLLGRTTEDEKFIAILKQNGIAKAPRGNDPNTTLNGVTLSFCHPAGLRGTFETTTDSTAVFFGMMVHLSDLEGAQNYSGALPYKLKSSDSLQAMTEKLGKPTSANVKAARYVWKMDPFDLVAFYQKDRETLRFISFVLPYATADR